MMSDCTSVVFHGPYGPFEDLDHFNLAHIIICNVMRLRAHRRKYALLLIAAIIVVGGGIVGWLILRAPSIPPPPKPIQHLYPSDDGFVAGLEVGQRFEFDFGDMSQWKVEITDAATGKTSHVFARLSPTTYVPTIYTEDVAKATLTRTHCSSAVQPCSVTIQLAIYPANNLLPSGAPSGSSHSLTHP